jgi:hypothetical protein
MGESVKCKLFAAFSRSGKLERPEIFSRPPEPAKQERSGQFEKSPVRK